LSCSRILADKYPLEIGVLFSIRSIRSFAEKSAYVNYIIRA
jgi:hypothetical protein